MRMPGGGLFENMPGRALRSKLAPIPFEPARWATSNVTTVLASYSLSLCQPELVSVASPFPFPSIAHDRIPPLVFSLSMGCNDGSFGW